MCECKTQEKDRTDAYSNIREGLAFSQQRRNRVFWDSLQ